MDMAIGGVINSVRQFADSLRASGVDVRLGCVAFGDLNVDYIPLTADIDAFKNRILTVKRTIGDDSPEYPLGAIAYAVENFDFRAQAQKIFVVITDVYMHQKGDSTYDAENGAHFDYSSDDIVEMIRNRFVVHVVDPDGYYDESRDYWESGGDKSFARYLAEQTGGAGMNLDYYGNVDLSTLPIKDFITGGYLIGYSTGQLDADHTVRLVAETPDGGTSEVIFNMHY